MMRKQAVQNRNMVNMKSVLFINNKLGGGGSERVMILIANELYNLGYHVEMVVLASSDISYDLNSNIILHRFDNESLSGVRYITKSITFIKQIIDSADCDTVISFMAGVNFLTLCASIISNKKRKIIVSERSDPKIYHSNADRIIKKLNRLLYTKANKVVFQSKGAQDCFPKSIVKKSVIIPNPITVDREVVSNSDRKDFIVTVGRLVDVKDHSLIINAFNEVHKIHPSFVLRIFGDGPLKDILREQIINLNLEESVFLEGYCQDVLEQIASAKVFVLASKYEGMPNALMEAMALGIPCIATDCPSGGVRSILKDKENGLLIKVGDKDSLVQALFSLIGNNALWSNISKEAQKVKVEYSMNRIIEKWIELL